MFRHKQMSVIRPRTTQTFVAPIAICNDEVSLSGSWSQQAQLNEAICNYRVRHWSQQINHHDIDMKLHFCIIEHLKTYKFQIEWTMTSDLDCEALLSEATHSVQQLLRQSKIKHIANIFQHEHPGAGNSLSGSGNAGKDGAIQSV